MAELLIITRNPKTYSYRRFIESAQDLGYLVDTLLSNAFCGFSKNKNYDLILHRDTGVSFDDVDLLLANYFEGKNQKVLNSPSITEMLRSKDKQYLWFLKHGLPHIPSLILRGPVQREKIFASEEYVLKTTRGNQGKGVMLVSSLDSLLTILEANHARSDERYIVQPKLKLKSEWRILILGDEILGAVEKSSPDDFRANAKRAMVTPVKTKDLPSPIVELSQRVQKLLPDQFLGLDIGMSNEGPVIIEVNTMPGFEVFDELHQMDVAKRFWETYL